MVEETLSMNAPAEAWVLPSRGIVGMACLIAAEAAVFVIFVIAYIYYIGKNLSGPTPAQVLEVPALATICLLSSSLTVHLATAAARDGRRWVCIRWLAATLILGWAFLGSTALEWYSLIYKHSLTIQTNLFGTTFYSLIGLHGIHVIVGLVMLSVAFVIAVNTEVVTHHADRLEVVSLYWHFVDAVWVVVFLVVYIFGL